MSQLPADVLVTILGFACVRQEPSAASQYTFKRRRAWFASTLLVGRAWYAAGQPILYRRIFVSFQDDWQFDSLLRTLTTPNRAAEGRTLARNIHELHIRNLRHESTPEYHNIFPVPGIPIVTQKGRRGWRRKRQYDKLRCLLGMCSALKRLDVYAIHISKLAPALENLWVKHRRLEYLGLHDVTLKLYKLWSHLAQFEFWSHLLALAIHAPQSHWKIENVQQQLGDFHSALKGGHLVSLKIYAHIHAMALQDILRPVQLTLRTLICNEPIQFFFDKLNAGIFGSVAETLTSLTLTLESPGALANINSITGLIHLKLVLKPNKRRVSRRRPISVRAFPPNVQTIEWRANAGVDPWILAERVRDTLRAQDHRLVGLHSITVTATLQPSRELGLWTILAALLHGVTETRPRVQLSVDLLLDLNHFDLPRFDCFARQIMLRNQQKLEDWKLKVQRRDLDWTRILYRGLEVGGSVIGCIHRGTCCALYLGCCCCLLGGYIDLE